MDAIAHHFAEFLIKMGNASDLQWTYNLDKMCRERCFDFGNLGLLADLTILTFLL